MSFAQFYEVFYIVFFFLDTRVACYIISVFQGLKILRIKPVPGYVIQGSSDTENRSNGLEQSKPRMGFRRP